MTTKLNSYILPDEIKKEMMRKLDNTQQDELGFALCSKNDTIIAGKDTKGVSDRIEIDPSMCEKGEKFLGGYHTHPRKDSYASAEDLISCGTSKIICTGGKTDNKIRCNIWKYGQLSPEDINKMKGGINKNMTESELLKYQQRFDCVNTIYPLLSEEKDIKKLNKDLDETESLFSVSKRSMTVESVTRIQDAFDLIKEARNMRTNSLVRKIEDKSKKYYNEVEII